jgi:hypothetical protein
MSSSEDDNRYTNDINYKHAERERETKRNVLVKAKKIRIIDDFV